MEISVNLTGLETLLQNLLKELPAALDVPTLRRALLAAGEPMRAGMAVLAPRGPDAPHIADNILIKPLSPRELEAVTDDTAGVEIGPASAYFYGYFWEFGTSREGWVARPFVRPALDAHQGEALTILEQRLGAAILQALETPR